MSTHVSIDGRILPAAEALVPVTDRGFRYGDALFETLRLQAGIPRFWEWHRARLERGLSLLSIPAPALSLAACAVALLEANGAQEGILRIQVTRGGGGRGYLPEPGARPRLVMETLPAPAAPESLHLWHTQWRRATPDGLPNEAKIAQGLASTLARLDAAEHGKDDALMTNRDGHVCELSGSALIWEDAQGRLACAAASTGALAGVVLQAFRTLLPASESRNTFAENVIPESIAAESIAAESITIEALTQKRGVVACNAAWGCAVPILSLAPYDTEWACSQALARRMNRSLQEAMPVLQAPHRAAFLAQARPGDAPA